MNKAKPRFNNYIQNNNSKSRYSAKNIGKALQERVSVIQNDGKLKLIIQTSEKLLTNFDDVKSNKKKMLVRNNEINTSRLNNEDSINYFINKIRTTDANELEEYIAGTKTDNNFISIPFPDSNPAESMQIFISKIQSDTNEVTLPSIPDPSAPAYSIQQTIEQNIIDVLNTITTTQNPQLQAFLVPGSNSTTTGGTNAQGIPEVKAIAGENMPNEFNQNPFIDMAIQHIQTNQVLYWNGSTWTNGVISLNLEQLLNVNINMLAPNHVLTFDGSKWVNASAALGGPFVIQDATNVDSASDPNDSRHYLGWDNTIKQWINRRIQATDISGIQNIGGANTLNDLTDVIINAPTNNQTVLYNGSLWINSSINLSMLNDINIVLPTDNQILLYNSATNKWLNTNVTELLNIADLKDVSVNTPTPGQIIQYNGTNWTNASLPSLGTVYTWYIVNQQSAGTYGGIAITDTWTPVILNTILINSGSDIIINNNQITIQSGNYNIDINIPFYRTETSRIRLYDIINNNTLAISHTILTYDGSSINLSSNIIISTTSTLELQYYVTNSVDNADLGVPSGVETEIYASIRLSKMVSTTSIWIFTDTKLIGNVGGTATVNIWTVREINNVLTSGGANITLFNNNLTINAGSYHVDITSNFYNTKNTRLRFRNITNNITTAVSSNFYSSENASVTFNFNFDITSSKVFQLQYYVSNSSANIDLGVPSGIDTELYTIMRITKF